MRWLILLGFVTACTVSGVFEERKPADSSDDDPCGNASGALPPPRCGEGGSCACCGTCSALDGLCFGVSWQGGFGLGTCTSEPVAGTLDVTIGGTVVVATEVAAIASDAYVQVSARAGNRVIVFTTPAVLGTTDCSDPPIVRVSYTDGDLQAHAPQPGFASPVCSVTLTAIGAVGERIEGAFAVTLLESTTARPLPEIELTAGSFSVERVAYP